MKTHKCARCHDAWATVYAIDPVPGGWGDYYCRPCAKELGWKIIDELDKPKDTIGDVDVVS